jgi:hypothetical protein
MRLKNYPLLLMVVIALFSASFNAFAVSCAPLVSAKVNAAPYKALNTALSTHLVAFKAKLDAVKDQATYAILLTESNATAASITNGRIVVTLADGTVVVDTSKAGLNTYANFKAKKINENHNSRIAILDSQLFECGIGVETKRSTTDGVVETYVARRLGNYLDNSGTVRISKK